ncbi:MAG: hypothetical protein GY795_41240 [Desulfobacterales bacterium]|nr:hypothetical protein [Desulfobacterales bacterium]
MKFWQKPAGFSAKISFRYSFDMTDEETDVQHFQCHYLFYDTILIN